MYRLRSGESGGDFTPELGLIVRKEKIAGDEEYNLGGDRYRENRGCSNTKWPMVALREVCEINPETTDPKAKFGAGDFVYIDISSVENGTGRVSLENRLSVDKAPSRARRVVKNNDVIISTVRPNLKAFAILQNLPDKIIASTGFAILRAKSSLEPYYLYLTIRSSSSIDQMVARMGKGSYPSINQNDVEQIKIPFPPLPVQREIIGEIEGYQKVIDGARAVVDNYRPHIPIDPEWPMVELGEVCEIKSGGTPSRSESSYWNGDIPWVGSTVCKDSEVNYAEEYITERGLSNSSAKIFPAKTTLIALVGATIGKTAFLQFDCSTNQNVAGLVPKDKSKLISEYTFYSSQMLYSKFLELGEGKFRMANLSFVRSLKIPLPPLEVQKEIVAEIEAEQALVTANRKLVERMEGKIEAAIARVWEG